MKYVAMAIMLGFGYFMGQGLLDGSEVVYDQVQKQMAAPDTAVAPPPIEVIE